MSELNVTFDFIWVDLFGLIYWVDFIGLILLG